MSRNRFAPGRGVFLAAALLAAPCEAADQETVQAGAPAVFTVEGNGTHHVLVRDAGGSVVEFFRGPSRGETWRAKDLTGEANAPKAASLPSGYVLNHDRSQHVVYRGEGGAVHELYLASGRQRWQHSNLTALTKAPPAAGRPAGYAVQGDRTQHVVYRTGDGRLVELYHVPEGENKGWHAKDLTAEAKAPKAAGDPVGYVLGDNKLLKRENAQHIVYRGQDNHLHELYTARGQDRWAHTNLTAATAAPRASGNPTGYVFEDRTQHVVYRAEDGSIHELFHRPDGPGKGWQARNVARETGAPPAAGDPHGFAFNDHKHHVVYRDREGRLQELYFSKAAGLWGNTDLSLAARAPRAATDPAGYAHGGKTQHVVYHSADGALVELFRSPDGDDRKWHVSRFPAATARDR